jgi:radical SAM superfamily enzyme YgiQ (UPF0313 family)
MKIILVRPPIEGNVAEVDYPLNLVMLGTSAREAGHDVRILDFEHLINQRPALRETFFPAFLEFMGDGLSDALVGMNSMAPSYPYALLMCKLIKERFPRAAVMLGGPHASFVPAETLRDCPFVDFVAVGEGERPLVMTADCLQRGKPEDLGSVPNLYYRDADGTVRFTFVAPLLENLDDLPLPDYGLLDARQYMGPSARFPVYMGSGCPYSCAFCTTSEFWQRKYRVKSPQRAVMEIERAKQAAASGSLKATFIHDNLQVSGERGAALLEALKASGAEWSFSTRLDRLDNGLLRRLRESGCYSIYLGVETGSPRMQKIIGKDVDLSVLLPILKSALEIGISMRLSFIIGFPEEGPEDLEQTLALALDAVLAGAACAQINTLIPFTGARYAKLPLEPRKTGEPYPVRFPTGDTAGVAALIDAPELRDLMRCFRSLTPGSMSRERIIICGNFFSIALYLFPQILRLYRDVKGMSMLQCFGMLAEEGRVFQRLDLSDPEAAERIFPSLKFPVDSLDPAEREALRCLSAYDRIKHAPGGREREEILETRFDIESFLKSGIVRLRDTSRTLVLRKDRVGLFSLSASTI